MITKLKKNVQTYHINVNFNFNINFNHHELKNNANKRQKAVIYNYLYTSKK